MPDPDLLTLSDERVIAYSRRVAQDANEPGVVFLGGFRSDMTGTKAVYLENWAETYGAGFLRFDYTGHGASSGEFEDGCIGDWARDALEAFDALTDGPQILVGSSMGGWIALLLAKARPERIRGLVGIAAAPDFTEDLMWPDLPEAAKTALLATGRVELPNDYSDEPYVLTRRLFEDGRDNLVLREPLRLAFPVRLLHGTADTDVPISVAMRLMAHIECPDAQAILVKDADHRMSEPRELALITATIESLLTGAGDV